VMVLWIASWCCSCCRESLYLLRQRLS